MSQDKPEQNDRDVTQFVHRDVIDGKRVSTESIPPAWAVPAENATGAPKPATTSSNSTVVVAIALICVGGALFGLYWMNANQSQTDTVASTTPRDNPAPAAAPDLTRLAAIDPEAPLAPDIGMGDVAAPAIDSALGETIDSEPEDTAPSDDVPAEGVPTEGTPDGAASDEGAAKPSPTPAELARAKKVARYNTRAELAIRMAKYKVAEELLNKAIRLDPTHAPLHRNLGVARARRRNIAGARAAYEEYIRLAPSAPDAPDVRRILGQ